MREIRFRAWDVDEKKMHYDVWVNNHAVSPNGYTIFSDEIMKPMQFTGLKDKDGKEIYEGDVLRHKKGTTIVQHRIGVTTTGFDLGLWDAEESKVIGNIYENPDLLK